jgi:hypothetical protein
LFTTLAEIALAYALDPSGKDAIKTAGKHAITFLKNWLGTETRGRIDQMIDGIRSGLETFTERERFSTDQVEAACANAEVVLQKHALDSAALTQYQLDPQRVAIAVLTTAADDLRLIGEPEASLCRGIIERVYTLLLDDAETLREMEGAFRRALLERLGNISAAIDRQPDTVVRAVRETAAGALLANPTRKWWPDRFPLSALCASDQPA